MSLAIIDPVSLAPASYEQFAFNLYRKALTVF